MKPAPTWLTPPRSTSTLIGASTKKTFITFGCSLVDSNPRLHQHPRRHRLQRQRLHRRLRLLLHRHLLPLQRQDLLLLQDPFLHQGGDQHRGRDPDLPAIGDRATASSKVDRLLLKMPVRLGPMGNQPPKAQISGGKAAFFDNAFHRATATGRVEAKFPFQSCYQIFRTNFSTRLLF